MTKRIRSAQQTLARNRRDAQSLADKKGVEATRALLVEAERDLQRRIDEAVLTVGEDAFTAVQLQTTLAQVQQVTRELTRDMKVVIVGGAREVAGESAGHVVEYLGRADREYRGVASTGLGLREASMLDRAVNGTESSVLRRLSNDPGNRAGTGILARYGGGVIESFETALQVALVARKPWSEVRSSLVAQSSFLQGAPAAWAERIARTEIMGAYNRAGWETMRAADDELGDMCKILCATFDNRTGADSYAVHGQIRRVDEAFSWWDGMYQHPPNRPNDREVVVPHRVCWPIPDHLAWRTDGEVAARWAFNGRKGGPPGRPKMTTIPLERFGVTEPPKKPGRPKLSRDERSYVEKLEASGGGDT